MRESAEPGLSAARLLSQLDVGSEECGAPRRGGRRRSRQERERARERHVEIITYLQLLVVQGGQSCHVEREVV